MWGEAGRVGSKKSKPIFALPRGVRLKSRPIPAPPPLQDEENLREGARQNFHPYLKFKNRAIFG